MFHLSICNTLEHSDLPCQPNHLDDNQGIFFPRKQMCAHFEAQQSTIWRNVLLISLFDEDVLSSGSRRERPFTPETENLRLCEVAPWAGRHMSPPESLEKGNQTSL